MKELYYKVHNHSQAMLLVYEDYSQMQICFNNVNKRCKLYRLYPDCKSRNRFMREFSFNLDHCLNKLAN